MNRMLRNLIALAIPILLLGGFLACSQETAPIPTSSSPVIAQESGELMTMSPIGATAPPAPEPEGEEEEENSTPQNGDTVTVGSGSAAGVTGCPDNCTIEMGGYKVSVPTSTDVTLYLGGQTYKKSTADLRTGLPLKVRGTYRNGNVTATRIIVKEDIRTEGTVVRLGGGKLILQIGGRGTASEVEFWIPTEWVIFGSPRPGTNVLVYAKVRRNLSDPFIATRVQPW